MNSIKGKEFEALILKRASKLEEEGILTLGRYGVQAVMMNKGGKAEWQVVPSLPDFDGCISPNGQQIIIEAKVCSQASYPLFQTGKKRPKQIDHMLLRSKFGAICYLLIHFNPRELKTKSEPAATYAIQVHPDNRFWIEYWRAENKNLTREEAELYGIEVPWDLYSNRATTLTPDLTVLLP